MPLRRNSFAPLLAMLAMVLQLLWPFIAQARPTIAGERVPICTVAGVGHYVELPARNSPLDDRSANHDEHCKLCTFSADRHAVVPCAQLPVLITGAASTGVAASAQFSVPRPIPRALQQPRAPPLVS